jgi:CBS domain-containing protein
MAFYVSTNGVLHSYNFKYLGDAFERARLEKTEAHFEFPRKTRAALPPGQTEFFATDVMHKPVISKPLDALLEKIRDDMKIHKIRHIPIAKDHKLIGMISDRDLLKVEMAGTFLFLKAEDIMSKVIIVAEEETPLAHIARVLLEEKISAIPIINKAHKLVGMISRSDILRTVVYNRLVLK